MAIFPSFSEVTSIKRSGLYVLGEHGGISSGISLPSGWLGDMIRVDSDYILELWSGGQLMTATTTPQIPSSIRVTRPHALYMQRTLGRFPVRHHSLNRILNIEIRGKTGAAKRQGYNRAGNLVTESGLDIMLEFDAFLDLYNQRASEAGALNYTMPELLGYGIDAFGSSGTYLVLRCLKERLHVKVEPKSFEYERTAERSRAGADWTLVLEAWSPAKPDKPGGLFGGLQDYINYATACVSSITNLVNTANSFIDSVNQGLEGLLAPLRALTQLAAALRSTVGGFNRLADFPRALVADCIAVSDQMLAAVNDAVLIKKTLDHVWGEDNSGVNRSADDKLNILAGLADINAIALMTMAGVAGIGPAGLATNLLGKAHGAVEDLGGGTSFSYSPDGLPLESGFAGDIIQYQIGAGESVYAIIKKFYKPGEAPLPAILAINKMFDPFTWATGAPIQAGDPILLPGTGLSGGGMFVDKDFDVENMFGRDILLDPATGDFVIDGSGREIKTVRGAKNLEYALWNRCRTPIGTSRHFPEYGMVLVPGSVFLPSIRGIVAAHISEQVARDPRVAGVDGMVLLDSGDGVTVRFDAVAEIGQIVNVAAPIGG